MGAVRIWTRRGQHSNNSRLMKTLGSAEGLLVLLLILYPVHCRLIQDGSCTSTLDCELLGECINGRCVCDPGWTGPTCTSLKQADSMIVWPRDSQTYSWGASIVRM